MSLFFLDQPNRRTRSDRAEATRRIGTDRELAVRQGRANRPPCGHNHRSPGAGIDARAAVPDALGPGPLRHRSSQQVWSSASGRLRPCLLGKIFCFWYCSISFLFDKHCLITE